MSTTTPPIGLNAPIIDKAIWAGNFFNGRLLTSKDLGREQDNRRQADAWLGQAMGAGIAWGLEVNLQGEPAARTLQVKAGLAVNRAGQTLQLAVDQTVALVTPSDTTSPGASTGFAPCGVLSGGTYVAGNGLYLLTLAPIMVDKGTAPVLAVDPGNVRCNSDARVEAVQLRLLYIDDALLTARGIDSNVIAPAAVSRLRNGAAYACFGFPAVADAHLHPGSEAADSLLDALAKRDLSRCDVPLALIYLTGNDGIVFVDRWAVRRRIAAGCAAPPWSALLGEPMDALGEAQLLQFQEQLADLSDAAIGALTAATSFTWLPPAGFLDATGPRRLDWRSFLGPHQPVREVPLAAGDVRGVLTAALRRDPLPMGAATRYRVYRIDGSAQWLFVREAPNVLHAEEVWLDGARARLPGVDDVQAAIDALRARSCGHLGLWPGSDVHARLDALAQGENVNLCLEAGDYALDKPLTLKGLGHVVVHGCGAGSLLRNATGEIALLVQDCASLTVSGLSVRAEKADVGKGSTGIGLHGALTVIDTPQVRIERVRAQCGAGKELAAGGIVVTHSKPTLASSVSINDCELLIGESQLGILCVNCEQAFVTQNTVRASVPGKVLQRAIVVAGELAREVRIADNVLGDAAQGIAIGLSRAEESEGTSLQVERALVVGNSVRVRLGEADLKRNRFGIFVGNAQSLLVQGNRVTVDDERVFEAGMESLRLSGAYGRSMVVRDNHVSGTSTGINFAPQGALPDGSEQCLWVFEANLAEQGQVAIQCTEEVRRLLRERNNLVV